MAKIALLVGVSEYELLHPLPSAQKDIEAMQQVLADPGIGGFDQVLLLPNPEWFEMHRALENLFTNRQRDDLVLLYFSGHGLTDIYGDFYLTTPKTLQTDEGVQMTTAVAAKSVYDFMNRSRSKQQVVILDCCFSGAFPKGIGQLKSGGSIDIEKHLGGGEGRAVLTSSSALQYSFGEQKIDLPLERIRNGLSVYTRYLVEGIEKGAADTDGDGKISVYELHEYTKRKVHEAAPAMKPELYANKDAGAIKLAKAPIGEPTVEYRKEVEALAQDLDESQVFDNNGELSFENRDYLEKLRINLELSKEVASAIETEVLQPLFERKNKLLSYEELFSQFIQNGQPLGENKLRRLDAFQRVLKLRDEDIAPIKARILTSEESVLASANLPSIEPSPTSNLPSEKGVDYTRLQDLLAAKNWKEANNETRSVMLQAAGQKIGEHLNDEHLLIFPCTDFNTIDQLWITHSGGKFGFSVQRAIYLNCKYDRGLWEDFGDRVGWRVRGTWIIESSVRFDDSAPEGHLPIAVFSGCKRVDLVRFFSRIEACKA